jgi:hypothetical protein
MIVAGHEVPGGMRKIARRSGTIENGSRLSLDVNIPLRGISSVSNGMNSVSPTNISDHDFDRPSATKAIRPSKGLALSQRLEVKTLG